MLSTVYAGRQPLTYGRWGRRQFAAAFARHLMVKDPCALLSLPAIVSVINATPVVLYRHPAAVWRSYIRQGGGSPGRLC